MSDVIKKVSPPSIMEYWETLLLLMPPQFFSEELSKLGSFTIIFSKEGKNHLMINRYCSVYSPLPNEDEGTVNVKDELSMNGNNSIGAQLKFKFTAKTKNFLVMPEENDVNDFVTKFFDEVRLISREEGSLIYLISGQGSLGGFKSNGKSWVKE